MKNKVRWKSRYLNNSLRGVINQVYPEDGESKFFRYLVAVHRSTQCYIPQYSNLHTQHDKCHYTSVALTPKLKQTRSLRCFVRQCKVVCNGTLHITNQMACIN